MTNPTPEQLAKSIIQSLRRMVKPKAVFIASNPCGFILRDISYMKEGRELDNDFIGVYYKTIDLQDLISDICSKQAKIITREIEND